MKVEQKSVKIIPLFLFGWSHIATVLITLFVADNLVTIKALVKKTIADLELKKEK